MIVKNEAAILARCLACVEQFADEIIIVDTGSRDLTKKIAKKFTSHVYDFVWCDDFSAARNFSFSLSSCDYIMWLDADDFVDSQNIQRILELKARLTPSGPPDCIMAKYLTSPPPHEFYYYRERFLRRVVGYKWTEPVHEVITPSGVIEYCDVEIVHKKEHPAASKRNLNIYRKILKTNSALSPRAMYYYARELYYNKYYRRALAVFDQFLETNGWVENKIDACILRAECLTMLHQPQKAQAALLDSFVYAAPRAKAVCLFAEILMQQRSYSVAADWLKIAPALPKNDCGWIEPDFYAYRPFLDLSICYYYLNNLAEARKYHQLAKAIHPTTPEILYNARFFE